MIPQLRRLLTGRLARDLWLAPLIIVLLAWAVRVHWLDHQSLWNDEGNSLRLAQRSTGDLIDAAGQDIHPPGYYLALKAWIGLAGESEFSLRALSALEGVLAVAVTIALGSVLFSRGTGVLAGLLVALSPFAVYYSQETRMYAQLGLLSAASMWAFVLWVRTARTRWALALALINAAGLYTQYSFPFTLLAQAGLFALWLALDPGRARRRSLVPYATLNLLTLLLFLPWLPTAWDQVTSWPRTGVDLAPGEQLRTVGTWITYGSTAGEISALRFLWPGFLVAAALWPPGARRLRRTLPYGWRVGLPLAWAGVVIGALLLSGAYREANLKFLLPAQIAAALLIGQGARRLWRPYPGENSIRQIGLGRWRIGLRAEIKLVSIRRMLAAVCLFLVVIGQVQALDSLYVEDQYARPDYRAMAAYIMAGAGPGDAIILDAPNQAEVFSYYYHGTAPVYGLPRGLGGDDAQTRAGVDAVIRDHARIFVLFWGETERDPNRVVQATLDASAYPVASAWYGDVRLAHYAVLGPAPTAPQTSLDARFGESIALTGFALSTEAARPGDVLGVTLFWTSAAPLDRRYKVTVQLLAPDGTLAAQHDAEPAGNRALTPTWTPGETVIDTHGLVIPPGLPPDLYTLIAGLYDIDAPLDRLPVTQDGAPVGNHAFLARVRVR